MAKIGLCIIRHSISSGKVHLNWKSPFQVGTCSKYELLTCPKLAKWLSILRKKMWILWFKYGERNKIDEINTIKAELKISKNTIKIFIITKEFCEYYC